MAQIGKFQRGPARARQKLNKLIEPFDKGIVLDSEHVIAERQPDGRIKLQLSPNLLRQLGLPSG